MEGGKSSPDNPRKVSAQIPPSSKEFNQRMEAMIAPRSFLKIQPVVENFPTELCSM